MSEDTDPEHQKTTVVEPVIKVVCRDRTNDNCQSRTLVNIEEEEAP